MGERRGKLIGLRPDAEARPALAAFSWEAEGFVPAPPSPYTQRPSLFAEHRGAWLDLRLPEGAWEILVTRHPWSGQLLLRDSGQYALVDLYTANADSGVLSIPVQSGGEHAPVRLEATGLRSALARGSQVWFLGVRSGPHAFHPESGEPVSESCRLIRGQHGTFLTLRTDTGIANWLAAKGVWEADSVDVFARWAKGARIAIDIGANFGHHSVVLSRLLAPGGRLFAFEPQMQMYNLLNANLVLNGCTNVEPHRMGLGAAPAKARMWPISYASFANFGALGVQREGADAGELVDILPLDDFLARREVDIAEVDFVKMDVQSFELFVFQGAMRTLEHARPVLYFEVAPYWMERRGYDYREIYRLLAVLGYAFHDDDMTPHAPPEWDGNSRAEWNVLALPPGKS